MFRLAKHGGFNDVEQSGSIVRIPTQSGDDTSSPALIIDCRVLALQSCSMSIGIGIGAGQGPGQAAGQAAGQAHVGAVQ